MDNLESLIASAVKKGAENVGETGRKFAILGNQQGVVVDETTRPYNAMWVHIAGQEPFMAIDSSGQLTYDNTAGGLEVEVEIGYPAGRQEGKDTPHILRITERGKQALGGITPAQMGLVRAQSPQVERLTTLRLTKGSSGLVVGMTGGWYMRGGYLDYADPNDNIADLTSYLPSTTGYSKYIVVCWDGNQAVIEERAEFDPASFVAPDMIKGTITPGCLRLGYALLEQGVTAWPDNDHVLPLPHLYNTEGLTTAAIAPAETDDSDAGYSQHWRWLDTATGNIYYCTDASVGAAVWKLQSAGGAGGNVFESLYVQGTAYQHSFTNNQILQSAYSADAIGVLPIYAKARGTLASPGNVVQNDVISNTYWWAYHTSAFRSAAQETVTVIDASPSATSMQTKRAFLMTDSSSVTPTAVMDMTAARINFSVPIVVPSYTTAAIGSLTAVDGTIVYDSDTDTFKGRQNGTFTEFGGGGGIAVEEAGSSIVAAATTLDFKDFNVEDDGSNQAGIYHNINSIFQARLTLTSGSPYAFNSDVTSTTIYLSPLDSGDQIALYDGTRVKLFTHTEKSFPLTNVLSCTTTNASTTVTTADTSQLVAGMKVTGTGIAGGTTISSITNSTTLVLSANATASATNNLTFKAVAGWVLDLYVYPAAGTTPKMIAVKWSTATTKPSRPTNNGFVTKNGDATARFIGSVMVDPDTDGQTCLIRGALAANDQIKPKWLVSNAYNKIIAKFGYDVEISHSYGTATVRPYNNDGTAHRGYVCLCDDQAVSVRLEVQAVDITTGTDFAYSLLGVDSTSVFSAYKFIVSSLNSLRFSTTSYEIMTAGGHTLYLLETVVNAVTFQNCSFVVKVVF